MNGFKKRFPTIVEWGLIVLFIITSAAFIIACQKSEPIVKSEYSVYVHESARSVVVISEHETKMATDFFAENNIEILGISMTALNGTRIALIVQRKKE